MRWVWAAFAAAALSLIDLITGFAAGLAAFGLPLLGAALAWIGRTGSAGIHAQFALAANVIAFVIVLAASLIFGGS